MGEALEHRVARAAEAALASQKFVAPIDVLIGLGWLQPVHADAWRQGRIEYLERVTVANLNKISTAMRLFRRWAAGRGLLPGETAYVARTRDRRPLRFSKTGTPGIERAYRTHWVSPELSVRKRARLAERQGIMVEEAALAEAEQETGSRRDDTSTQADASVFDEGRKHS